MSERRFFVGSYTSAYGPFAADGAGIELCAFDTATGAMRRIGTTDGVVNPSYLALDAAGRRLYAVEERPEGESPSVAAFEVGPDGRPSLVGRAPTRGGLPCHLGLDATGRWLAVAHYGGGSVEVHPVGEDGALGAAGSFVRHRGRSVHPERQTEPHAHAAVFAPDDRWLLVPDLGLDQVVAYRFDGATGALTPDGAAWEAPAGAGPRHLAWHPSGAFAFVVCELASTLVALRYREGRLEPVASVSTLPAGFDGESTCAAVRVHPRGHAVYASNRGHDSLAVARFDPEGGALEVVQHVPSGGRKPRDFVLAEAGGWLLASNHDSGTLASYRVAEDGTLAPTGHALDVPSPACLGFLPARRA